MRTIKTFTKGGLAVSVLSLIAGAAFAQIPDHPKGSICVTARVWCWADVKGKPGQNCTCPTPYGQAQGRLQ